MKRLAAIAILTVLAACDKGGSSGGKGGGGTGGADAAEVEGEVLAVAVTPTEFPVDPGNLTTTEGEAVGPRTLVLDARAIQSRFRRVFPKYRENAEYFSPIDKHALGTIVQTGAPAAWKNSWDQGLSQQYLRLLRRTLALACRQAVDLEHAALKASAEAAKTNALVRSLAAPSEADVHHFMGLVFGYAPVGGATHLGAALYAQAFADELKEAPKSGADREAQVKAAYRSLCTAVGQDLRTILR